MQELTCQRKTSAESTAMTKQHSDQIRLTHTVSPQRAAQKSTPPLHSLSKALQTQTLELKVKSSYKSSGFQAKISKFLLNTIHYH